MLKKTVILSLSFGVSLALMPMLSFAAVTVTQPVLQGHALWIDDNASANSANTNDYDNATSSDSEDDTIMSDDNSDSSNDDSLSSDATE